MLDGTQARVHIPSRRWPLLLALAWACAQLLGPAHALTPAIPTLQAQAQADCPGIETWNMELTIAGYGLRLYPGDNRALQARWGIPKAVRSCITAEIDGYVIEGPVPPAAIAALLQSRPDAIGLAVKGVPGWNGSIVLPPELRPQFNVYLLLRHPSGTGMRTEVWRRF